MFELIVTTVNPDDSHECHRYATASDFFMDCEEGDLADVEGLEEKVVGVSHRGGPVQLDGIEVEIVKDLYFWMCSDDCDWFD